MPLNVLGANLNPIANPLPFGLLPAVGSGGVTYSLTDIAYDFAIAGIPFLAGESLRGTYFRRQYLLEFAEQRKQQFDNQNVPGEQSLSNWWLRSQNSFHYGAGIQYLDPTIDQTQINRYSYSEGLDTLSTPGQTTLLPATKTIATGLTGPVKLRGVVKGGTDGVLVLDVGAKTLQFITTGGVSTSYTMAAGLTGLAATLTDDGTNYYYADKTGIYQGPIATPGSAATKVWNVPSTSGNYVIGWVKGRLVGGLDNNVYELVGAGGPTLPTPKFVHNNTSYTYSSIAAVPQAIIVAGSVGSYQSDIYRFVLDSGGALPVLTSGTVTATMPTGEIINSMFSYLGTFVGISTTKGLRVATVDSNGNLLYGPLVVQDPSAVGCKGIAGYDRFLFTTNPANRLIPQQGWTNPTDASAFDMLIRVDLGFTTPTGSQPFANDLMTAGTDGSGPNDVVNVGTSSSQPGMLAFSTPTKVFVTDTANKQAAGVMYTGKIRYNTLENKHFKFVYLRSQNVTDGSISIAGQNPGMTLSNIISNVSGTTSDPSFIGNAGNSQEWFQLKFTLKAGTVNTNYSPVWNGYQLRALPGIQRQLLLTVPVICHDRETDKFGNTTGYDGFAEKRIEQVLAQTQNGNVVSFQDLNYNISYQVVLENMEFQQQGNEGPKTSSAGAKDANARSGYFILQCRVIQ